MSSSFEEDFRKSQFNEDDEFENTQSLRPGKNLNPDRSLNPNHPFARDDKEESSFPKAQFTSIGGSNLLIRAVLNHTNQQQTSVKDKNLQLFIEETLSDQKAQVIQRPALDFFSSPGQGQEKTLSTFNPSSAQDSVNNNSQSDSQNTPESEIRLPGVFSVPLYIKLFAYQYIINRLVRENNLAKKNPDVPGIVRDYFYSNSLNSVRTISSGGFKDSPVTRNALQKITDLFAEFSLELREVEQVLQNKENKTIQLKLGNFLDKLEQVYKEKLEQVDKDKLEKFEKHRFIKDSQYLLITKESPDSLKKDWEYSGLDTVGGIIAGGVGSGGPPPCDIPVIPDCRKVSLDSRIDITINGVSKFVTITANYKDVTIQDTFDFFPGGFGKVENVGDTIKVLGIGVLKILELFGYTYDVPFVTEAFDINGIKSTKYKTLKSRNK